MKFFNRYTACLVWVILVAILCLPNFILVQVCNQTPYDFTRVSISNFSSFVSFDRVSSGECSDYKKAFFLSRYSYQIFFDVNGKKYSLRRVGTPEEAWSMFLPGKNTLIIGDIRLWDERGEKFEVGEWVIHYQ